LRPTRIRDKKMLQFSNFDRVMEPETISKNGASLKSQTSRGKSKNFIFASFIFVVFLCFQNLKAQIALEYTFPTANGSIIFHGNVNLYVICDNPANQIKLYNADYSLYKIVTLPLINNFELYDVRLPSTAYSTNGKIGFVVRYIGNYYLNDHEYYRLCATKIYDEDAILLKDLGYCGSNATIDLHKANNQNRISIEVFKHTYGEPASNSYYVTEIYSLPKAHDITVITYRVIVNGGSGSGYYMPGDIVTIQAGTPPDGQQFKNWTVISPAGATIADSTLEKITFIMPPTPVTVTANFEATTTGTNILNTTSLLSYPNPAKTTINLPYRLKQGETSVMNIYNANGQLMETKKIDFVFDKIQLNVSGYTKGIYFYEVNGVSNKFIVN